MSSRRIWSWLVRSLPWLVAVGALLSLTPLLFDPALLLAHAPTFIVLLGYALVFARGARKGQSPSPVSVAAVVGGLGVSIGLMLVPVAAMREDPKSVGIYWSTWLLLPILGLVGSGLAAGLVAIGRLALRPR